MRRVRGGRGRRRAERGRACGRAGRRRHLRGGAGFARRQRTVRGHVRHPGRVFRPEQEALRLPQLPLRRAGADRLGHGRVPLRGRPEAHLQDRQRRRQKPGLDGRLRRALAFGRGAGVRGAEERHARPPRAEDEGRHRRHVRLRTEKRRALQVPVPGNGAGARRFGAHRGPGGARGFRPRGVHPRQGCRHPDGRRLLQQQGAAGEVHPHGGHGLRVKLPGGRRNGRVLPHGPGRGRRRVGVQQLG